jgi:hypothetical protein
MRRAATLALVLSLLGPDSSIALPAWLNGVAIGSWVQIPGTNISSVDPSPTPPGNSGPSSKIVAWCGAAMDTRDCSLYSVANGGHQDYSGNEVDKLRLTVDAPAWQQVIAPTPASQLCDTCPYYADGHPSSRHSYYTQVFVPQRDAIMMFGSGSYWCSGSSGVPGCGNGGTATDAYYITANAYAPANTFPATPPAVVAPETAVANPATGDVYMLTSNNLVVSYNKWTQATNKWSRLSLWGFPSGASGYYACGAFDTTRNQILYIEGTGGAYMYSVAKNNWTAIGGVPVGDQWGCQYVPALDVYLIQQGRGGGAVTQINAATFAATTYSTTGGSSIPAPLINGVFSRWQYCPQLGGIIYIPSYSGNVWFLRTNSVAAPPNAPTNLKAQ